MTLSNQTATSLLLLALGTGLGAYPLDLVDVYPNSEGSESVRVRLDSETAPSVEAIASALQEKGRQDATPEQVARMLAQRPLASDPAGTVSFNYAPSNLGPPTMSAPSSSSSGPTGFAAFLQVLATLFQLFPSNGAAMTGTSFTGSGTYGTSGSYGPTGTSYTGSGTSGSGLATTGMPGGLFGQDGEYRGRDESAFDAPEGPNYGGAVRTNPRGSFFKSLPLPAGSWKVGPNGHFWDCRSSCSRPHHGNDLHAAAGTPVFSVAAGTVKRVKYNSGGYHWYVIIQHDAVGPTGAKYNTLYAHIAKPDLQVGQRVTAGQKLSTVTAAEVRSPHCHFEVLRDNGTWKGIPLNPNAFANFHDADDKAQVAYTRSEPPAGRGLA